MVPLFGLGLGIIKDKSLKGYSISDYSLLVNITCNRHSLHLTLTVQHGGLKDSALTPRSNIFKK